MSGSEDEAEFASADEGEPEKQKKQESVTQKGRMVMLMRGIRKTKLCAPEMDLFGMLDIVI